MNNQTNKSLDAQPRAVGMFKPILDSRPENEILLCCARTVMDEKRSELLKALIQKSIDWTYLVELAQRHGLMPLLYKNISIFCPEEVPPEILEGLKNQFEANEQRNIFLTGELIKLLYVLESSDVPAIPFKGPALAALVYGDLALRQFSDLDVLVKMKDVLKTRDLLVTLGYAPEFQLKGAQAMHLLKYQYEYPFIHNNDRIFIELQWEIAPRYLNCPPVLEQLWKYYKPSSNESFVSTLPPEYLLLMLCIHGTKDFWRRLICVCDVAELIRVSKNMDWPTVIKAGHFFGCQRMLFLGLFFAKYLLETPLPDIVLREIEADPTIRKLAHRILKRLFQKDDELPGFRSYFFYLLSKERLRDKIHFFLRLITTISPQDWAFIRFPPSLYILYYFVRPIRLAAKYIFKLKVEKAVS
jgi:hypothetical protein